MLRYNHILPLLCRMNRQLKAIAAATAFTALALFMAVAYTACTKTLCGNTVCQNKGSCVQGICVCPTGYEGTHCDTVWSTKFTGAWVNRETVVDSTGTYNEQYIIHVRPDTLGYNFFVDSLEQSADSITATYHLAHQFYFPIQYRDDSLFVIEGGANVQGTINLTGDTIQAGLVYYRNQLRRTATMVWTRQ